MKTFFCLIFILIGTNIASADFDPNGSLELHAHLFMKEGMSWGFRGEFFDDLEASNFKDRFSSQANPDTLERSGISLVVEALYAHPIFVWSLRNSIRKQIELTTKFVTLHPNWVIAKNPKEARDALNHGKRVIVLALEGASGILESEEDLKEFVDTDGIRIVTLLHLTDDQFGGVAFLKGTRIVSSPWAWIKSLFHPSYENGVKLNSNGLSPEGVEFAKKLIARGVWIDLAHASDASQRTLVPILRQASKPLLYTHTMLRRYYGVERGISDAQLQELAKSGGFIGLMPSEDMLEGTPRPDCDSGISALAVQYKDVASILGAESIALGTDYNGGVEHLKPSSGCKTGTSIDREGFWNISQAKDVWTSLRALHAPVPNPLSKTLERFLETWEKASLSR